MSAVGMAATVIATELVNAMREDQRRGGTDPVRSGCFGPAATTYLRALAAEAVDPAQDRRESGAVSNPFAAWAAATEFALRCDEGLEFLRAWMHGDWDVIRREWPEAPPAVYLAAAAAADLFDEPVEAFDVALTR